MFITGPLPVNMPYYSVIASASRQSRDAGRGVILQEIATSLRSSQ